MRSTLSRGNENSLERFSAWNDSIFDNDIGNTNFRKGGTLLIAR